MNYVSDTLWMMLEELLSSFYMKGAKLRRMKTYLVIQLVTEPDPKTFWGQSSCLFPYLHNSHPKWRRKQTMMGFVNMSKPQHN
jgi:hypothetical protein